LPSYPSTHAPFSLSPAPPPSLPSSPTRRSSDLLFAGWPATRTRARCEKDVQARAPRQRHPRCRRTRRSNLCAGPSRRIASPGDGNRKSTRLNSSHLVISYAVLCLKKKNQHEQHYVGKDDTQSGGYSDRNTRSREPYTHTI